MPYYVDSSFAFNFSRMVQQDGLVNKQREYVPNYMEYNNQREQLIYHGKIGRNHTKVPARAHQETSCYLEFYLSFSSQPALFSPRRSQPDSGDLLILSIFCSFLQGDVESVKYPTWCYPIIFFLIFASCIFVPLVFLVKLCQRFATKRKGDGAIVEGTLL